jgi:hypothetical protein
MTHDGFTKRAFVGTLTTALLAPGAGAYSRFNGAFFDPGSTTINERGRLTLAETANFYPTALDGFRRLQQFGVTPTAPSPWIHVKGYAPDGAHDAESEFLASMRALNAAQILLEAGLPQSYLVVSSFAARVPFMTGIPRDDPQNRVVYVSFLPSAERWPGALPPFER